MSSSSSSPTPSEAPTAKDPRLTPVIVVLSIMGVLLFILIGVLTFKLRRRKSEQGNSTGPFYGTSIWEREHPAAQITPFGAPRNAPRFNHTPGADMRIAIRRPDGAWHFADSRTPFKPAGVSDLDNTPSPSPMSASSSSAFFPFSARANASRPSLNGSTLSLGMYDNPMSTKELEARAARLAAAEPRKDADEHGYGYGHGIGPDPFATTPPPPAYQQHPKEES